MTEKRTALHVKILIGLTLGAILGFALPRLFGGAQPVVRTFIQYAAAPIGDIFLALLLMIVVPLVVSALVMGMQELTRARHFGKVGVLSLLLTVFLSLIACSIAFTGVNLAKPGAGIPSWKRTLDSKQYSLTPATATSKPAEEPQDAPVLGLIPKNPFAEMVRALNGGLLPLMVFAILFGAALAGLPDDKAKPLRDLFESVFETSQRVVGFTMRLAPYAVFCLVFRSVYEMGPTLLWAVARYFFLVVVLLALHQFGVYGLFVRFIARRDPFAFFRQMRLVMLTAFVTSSSNATLPTALRAADDDVGLRREISSFVLTIGATANQNGTAIFEGVAILFLAQLFGRDLSFAEQTRVFGLTFVAGIGTAGVPSASLPFIVAVLASIGLPAPAIGVILGVDRLLDMSRTVLNVTGDMVIACCIERLVPGPAAIPEAAFE